MRYRHVSIAAVCHALPPEVVTSAEIESRLRPVYERLGLPEGRLELMTGIRERRFFPRGTRPGQVSAQVATQAVEQSGIDRALFGGLIHGSVCRDQLEPATASFVHHAAGLPQSAFVLDVSNACLGLLNGMILLADMIELGQIRAGVVVGTEDGRPLVEGTIESLLANPALTRQDVKQDFASLTIGSGSAAIVLCDRKLCPAGHRLLGGAFRAETASHELCTGGENARPGDPLRMQTDSEALLHAGVALARGRRRSTHSAGRTTTSTKLSLIRSAERIANCSSSVSSSIRRSTFPRLNVSVIPAPWRCPRPGRSASSRATSPKGIASRFSASAAASTR